MDIQLSKEARKFFKKVGSLGGKARAKKYGAAQKSEWAKLGGCPPWSQKWQVTVSRENNLSVEVFDSEKLAKKFKKEVKASGTAIKVSIRKIRVRK